MDSACVVSIDIGVLNLGLVEARIKWTERKYHPDQSTDQPMAQPARPDHRVTVLRAERVDITDLKHKRVPREACKLYHTRDMCDRVAHFVQEYRDVFDRADVVLIERQPLSGLTSTEQLLYSTFREKAVLCSPTTMHCWLKIRDLDYEARKEATTKRAAPYLEGLASYTSECRQHDIADALCFVLWYAHEETTRRHSTSVERWRAARRRVPTGGFQTLDAFFDRFRYTGRAQTAPAKP